MYIKEVCKECNLTKKAIEYYEQQGLVSPKIEENGYRNYSNDDILLLKEIGVLRKLGICLVDIKEILNSNNKKSMLWKCIFKMNLEEERTIAKKKCLEQLIKDYDINYAINYIEEHLEKCFTIKEKLLQAFPGSFGMYLCAHFGQFLNEKIDTKEKQDAYDKIVDYLDTVAKIEIPKQLEEFLLVGLEDMKKEDIENMHYTIMDFLDNVDEYLEKNKENIDKYLEIRNSDEYKKSPAYEMQQLLLKLQQQSGYYENFLKNLMILSKSYRDYWDKLQKANKAFFEKYPTSKNIY